MIIAVPVTGLPSASTTSTIMVTVSLILTSSAVIVITVSIGLMFPTVALFLDGLYKSLPVNSAVITTSSVFTGVYCTVT